SPRTNSFHQSFIPCSVTGLRIPMRGIRPDPSPSPIVSLLISGLYWPSAAPRGLYRPLTSQHVSLLSRLVQFMVFVNSMKKIDLRRADLNLLVVFQRLLAERHVGRAAKRLHVTQSAASHALGRLRTMFDDPLSVRHPKGVQPTSRALALAPAIADILERANTLLVSPGGFDPNLPHTFTIGGTDLAVFTVLNPLIKRLRATAPKVDLRVRSLDGTRVVAAFDRQEIDCALVPFVEAPARIAREPLIEE